MSKYDDYRAQADDCQRMAAGAVSPDDKARWLKLAADWLALIPQSAQSQQPVAQQQQQVQPQPDDKE